MKEFFNSINYLDDDLRLNLVHYSSKLGSIYFDCDCMGGWLFSTDISEIYFNKILETLFYYTWLA